MEKSYFLEQPRRGNTHEVQLTPYNRSAVWGRTSQRSVKMVVIILLAILATACDPGYTEEIAIRNGSSHTVTVIPSPLSWYDSEQDTTFTHETKSYTIAPGEEVVVNYEGGIGGASFSQGESMFFQYYNDSVTFRFNGETGPQVVYHKEENTGISPYNFKSLNYRYEQKLNTGMIFHGHPNYGKLTFTITDEHYDAAWGWR